MRQFTLRQNGCRMTSFRIRADLSQPQIDDLLERAETLYGERWTIDRVLSSCLNRGIERLTLDSALDPKPKEA